MGLGAVTTYQDRLQGLAEGAAYKAPCRVATTANITLLGLQVIDGVQTVAGDRVLVFQQADQTQNGVYGASLSGWARTIDFSNTSSVTRGTQVAVTDGAAWGGQSFELQQSNVVFGTTDITFGPFLPAPVSAAMAPVVSAPTTAAARALLGAAAAGSPVYREILAGVADTATDADANGLIVWKSNTAAAKTQTLPNPADFPAGTVISVKDALSVGNFSFVSLGGGTIDLQPNYSTLVKSQATEFVSDGVSNWMIT